MAPVKVLTAINCSDLLGFLSNYATRHSLEYSVPSPDFSFIDKFIVIKINGHCVVHFACIINHPLDNKHKVIRINTAIYWLFAQITPRLCTCLTKNVAEKVLMGKWRDHKHLVCLIVSGNVAYNKSTFQGSGQYSDRYPASMAVDGYLSTNRRDCAWSQGDGPHGKTWQVDLGNTYSIDNIIIYGVSGEFMSTVHYTTKT